MIRFFAWLRERRINRLLVKRAGLEAKIRAYGESGKISPGTESELGEVNERLRQLDVARGKL